MNADEVAAVLSGLAEEARTLQRCLRLLVQADHQLCADARLPLQALIAELDSLTQTTEALATLAGGEFVRVSSHREAEIASSS